MNQKNKRWIRPLPERVINKIAAGEVIERPAAVVKELVENSIDAGSTRIEIVIEKSGTRLIKIVDNGCGIPEQQVEIAFSRHATSKIASFDDLNNLYSYGFRGEALPSVASVSRLRMVTRPHDEEAGTEIIYEGGVLLTKQPIAASPGTTTEVENLFYNTPARRKFLKAETTEARHISRTAMALAIGRPDIAFSYSINGKKMFALPADSDLKDRISAVLGEEKKLVKVEGEIGPVRVVGYIGTPEMAQNNRYGQFVFINSRYIYSPTLAHALSAGYGELIPRGTYPTGAILLTVDPTEVDVNVHPTKAEVRLSREREIHDAVYRIVKNSLQQDGIVPLLKPSGGTASWTDRPKDAGRRDSSFIPGVRTPGTADFSLIGELYKTPASNPNSAEPDLVRVDRNTGEVIEGDDDRQPSTDETQTVAGFRLIGRFANLYLLFQSGDDLFIIDQHTAHERVLYEETLARVESQSVEAQTLLFPEQIELNAELLSVFDEACELLNQSGFAVSHFGGRMVNIEAVPSVLSRKSPTDAFTKVLDDYASLKASGHDMKKAMAQSIACRSAVMAGDRLGDEEATHLINRLLECENRYSCPHGRPTFIKLSREDLDKQFGRA